MKTAKIEISNLKLRLIIGLNPEERIEKQEVVVNIIIETDVSEAVKNDNEKNIVNYRTITKKIIEKTENTNFFLLEKLTDFILNIVMEDKRISFATVKALKPNALRFSDSVAIELSGGR